MLTRPHSGLHVHRALFVTEDDRATKAVKDRSNKSEHFVIRWNTRPRWLY